MGARRHHRRRLLGLLLGTATSVYLEEIRQFVLWATSIDLFPLKVYNLDRVPHEVDPLWLLQVAGTALVVGILVTIYPAWRAARLKIVDCLRAA